MKRVKKPKNKKKPVLLTQHQLDELKTSISRDAVTKSVCLFIAYMMEEEEINFDADRIGEMVDGIDGWAGAIDDHLISLRNVADIIKEKTGMVVKW